MDKKEPTTDGYKEVPVVEDNNISPDFRLDCATMDFNDLKEVEKKVKGKRKLIKGIEKFIARKFMKDDNFVSIGVKSYNLKDREKGLKAEKNGKGMKRKTTESKEGSQEVK